MATKFLNEVFRNYVLTIAFCHSSEVERHLESAGRRVFVDVFARIPRLETWILCWSTTGPNTVNRVFVPDSNADFAAGLDVTAPKILHVPHEAKANKGTIETDVALLYRRGNSDTIAYCPIWSPEHGTYGTIRLIGRGTDITAMGYAKGAACQPATAPVTSELPDPDRLPHVLGRWAGSIFRHRETKKPLDVLLRALASFFTTAHAMYWKRDFDTDEVLFHYSPTPGTGQALQGLRASIHSHDYMFAIVAERGASEIVHEFPENLQTDLRIGASEWKRTDHFEKLQIALGGGPVSYIGIPLKVDDSVVGVISVVTPRGSADFREAARFGRSAIAEMGKTIDKCAVCRASRIIRQFASGKVSQEKKKPDLLPLGRDFVSELTKQLIPFGDVSVGAVEARLGAEEIGVSGLPLDVASVIQKQLIDLVVSEEVSLFVIEPQPTPHPHRGVLVVPVPAIYPRINK